MTQPYHMSEKDDWGTPQDFFNKLDEEFDFTLDACASPENAKCPIYFTKDNDGLQQAWPTGPIFVNPPYSHWEQWVGKADEERRKGSTIVMLLAARTDTKCFHLYFWDRFNHRPYNGIEVRFVKGRLRFQGATSGAPFPSMVIVMRPT